MKNFIVDMEREGHSIVFICFAEAEAKWIESALEVPAYVLDEFMLRFEHGPLHLDSKTLLLINETHNFQTDNNPSNYLLVKDLASLLGCKSIPYNFSRLLLERQYASN
ncbi:TPA: hypothetical protein UL936_001943 [Stenotrophomonas maltophilia]|nr:hypothetical protein [Stenotrophomonas maltophilia]